MARNGDRVATFGIPNRKRVAGDKKRSRVGSPGYLMSRDSNVEERLSGTATLVRAANARAQRAVACTDFPSYITPHTSTSNASMTDSADA